MAVSAAWKVRPAISFSFFIGHLQECLFSEMKRRLNGLRRCTKFENKDRDAIGFAWLGQELSHWVVSYF